MGYVNHMWNLYVSSPETVPATANDIDRADWTICRDVFAGLRTIEQNLILARHNPNRAIRDTAFREYYETVGLSEQNACIIIGSIAKTVAEKRGLIMGRMTREEKT